MPLIATVRGTMDEAELDRRVGLEDRAQRLVLWVEWRFDEELVRRDTYALPKALGETIWTTAGDLPRGSLTRTLELCDNEGDLVVVEVFRLGDLIVKRSPNVILKHPPLETSIIAGGL